VIVGGPSPIDDIADADGDRARVEVGPALSHGHIRRSRGSEDWQQDQKYERQSKIHRAIWPAGYHGNQWAQFTWDEPPLFWDKRGQRSSDQCSGLVFDNQYTHLPSAGSVP
jgi:hypothetical protein